MMDRPIRVILFGGGPVLEHGALRFVATLDAHPDVEFLGAVCQSHGQGIVSILEDLWRRRGLLALPLFAARAWGGLRRWLLHPRREWRLRSDLRRLTGPIRYMEDIHAPEVLGLVRELGPDLGLIYGSPILKPELFEIPKHGTLGIHHGSLPKYRGRKTTFWEMYEGEEVAGVTIQRVNRGLDTGEIVQEGRVRIGSRSRSRVWRELEDLGLELYLRAILEVRNGTARYRPQEGPKGGLYRDPPPSLILRLWWRQLCKRMRGTG